MANGDSDIKLVPGQVRIEAWDLCLDSADRRSEHNNPYRRALVHYDDGLVMNWGEDYPKGVSLNGVSRIVGYKPTTAMVPARTLTLESSAIRFLAQSGSLTFEGINIYLKRNPADTNPVQILGNAQFSNNVTFDGPAVFTGSAKVVRVVPAQGPIGPVRMEYDLFDMINSLQKRVADLEAKVASV